MNPDLSTKQGRREAIQAMVRSFNERDERRVLDADQVDFEEIALGIAREVGAPVIAFPVPVNTSSLYSYVAWRLAAYELPPETRRAGA